MIALFVIFGVLAITFAGIQLWKGENATVPPRILKKRSIAFGSWFMFCLGGSFFVRKYSSEYLFTLYNCHTAGVSLPRRKN